MALPKISHPTFVIQVPSTKKKVTFRPFLVKEEKMLLVAKASEQETDMLVAIKQIVNNCALDNDFDVDKIALFDMEYLFIKLRANSISDKVDVSYKDFEDDKTYDFEVDLNKVVINWPKESNNVIKITDKFGVTMKYPRASLYEDQEFLQAGDEAFFELIVRCIDKVYDGDEIFDAQNSTPKEVGEFLENLDVKSFDAIRAFMANPPSLYYEISYKNTLGSERKIEMKTLSDFFTLR